MEAPAERDDDKFEEVLGRLDALIRRGQAVVDPPPPPPMATDTSIPVLTEVYQPDAESVRLDTPVQQAMLPALPETDKLEQAVMAVLPLLEGVLEDMMVRQIQPAMEAALQQALADLRPQAEVLLRQRLGQLMAQEKDQTEM